MMTGFLLLQMEQLPMIERADCCSRHPVVTLLLLSVFVLICLLLSVQPRYFQDMIKVLFGTKNTDAFLRTDAAMPNFFFNLAAYFVAVVTLSAFAIFFTEQFADVAFNSLRCLVMMAAVVVLLLFKWLILKMFDATLAKDNTVVVFSRDYFWLVTFFGMLLYPLVVLAVYAPPSWRFACLVAMCVVVGLWAIFLLIKLVQYFFTRIGDLLYIFLYLCTLEIMPILLLRKLVFSLFEFV